MNVVTAEQMRSGDRLAIEGKGIPGPVLMENAGRAVVAVMEQEYGSLHGKRITVYCGGGNNGGDGFVIARYLHLAGAIVGVRLLTEPEKLRGDAAVHYQVLEALRIVPIESSVAPLPESDLIVDALLGTGIQNAPRAPFDQAIQQANRTRCPIIAVDIPSGVNADTGEIPGEAIRATHTVTFAYPKLGLLLFPGAACVGKLHIANIGFPWETLKLESDYTLLMPETVGKGATFLKKRAPETNKGDYGHVAILAGSRGMVGAPALTARAAQRSGTGLVTVLPPAGIQPVLAAKLDEQMTLPLPEVEGALSEAAYETIARVVAKMTVLCIGPGLTTQPETVALVQRLLVEIEKPIVLDADGLNALAQNPDILAKRPDNPATPLILTPHPGEAARLLGTSIAEVQSNRIAAVLSLARRFRAVALLKGRYTLIAAPNGKVVINVTGNPGMATGGMGDTLTGLVGGLLAQSLAAKPRPVPEDEAAQWATCLAAYLHGQAGDLAAAEFGQAALTAGDVIRQIPAAIQSLEVGDE